MGRQNNDIRSARKFRLVLIDDETHKNLQTMRFSRLTLVVRLVAIIIVAVILIYSLIAFTPLRTTIPGYPDAHSKKVALENALKIDSLESSITRWELYAENLSRVLSGNKVIRRDSIIRTDPLNLLADKPEDYLRTQDSTLREKVHNADQFQLGSPQRNLPIEGMHFFTPLKGVIVKDYDMVMHQAVDIRAPKGSVISSIFQGTVVFAGWDDDLGNVLIIQHPSDVISIYEHCEKLLCSMGDKVKAGTPVALVGNTGSQVGEETLHFALWCKGEAMDPHKYINF
ncbi:MAG: M23 family metallopeptidase [Bacteroidales bacterium]|nr:M23 family metallopeptidase [Candidatus Cryptobacteroides equifaecalis]